MMKTRWSLMWALVLIAAAAWAQGPQGERGPGRRPGAMGTVTAIKGDTITLKTMQGDTVTVNITPETQFRRMREQAKQSDIKVGDNIMVRGERNGDTITAQMVGIAPPGGYGASANPGVGGAPAGGAMGGMRPEDWGKTFVSGEVKKIEGTKLTIERRDGTTATAQADEQTSFKNDRGESITLADIKVGDWLIGRGALKDGVFVPSELRIGTYGPVRGARPQGEEKPKQ